MKLHLPLSLAVLLCSAAPLKAQIAQKYGHINSGNLLEALPEVRKADEQLKVLQDSLGKVEQVHIAAFEKEYQDFVKLANAGELPQVAIQKKQAEFQQKEEDILEQRKNAQVLVINRRKELLDPILKRVQDAVNSVAKEQGYAYVFDIGSGALLYAQESEDIEAMVRTKLGI